MKRVMLYLLRRQARRIRNQRKQLRLLLAERDGLLTQTDTLMRTVNALRDGARKVLAVPFPPPR